MFDKVQSLLADSLRISKDKITLDSRLKEDLGINSIDFADLVFQVEEEFDIEVEDDAPNAFLTVSDLVNYLEEKTK